jgi:hypothetical protein
LNEHIYALLPDGTRVKPTWDPRQVGEQRLSSVQYLSFTLAEAPTAIGISMPGAQAETVLSESQREALQDDLDAPDPSEGEE